MTAAALVARARQAIAAELAQDRPRSDLVDVATGLADYLEAMAHDAGALLADMRAQAGRART